MFTRDHNIPPWFPPLVFVTHCVGHYRSSPMSRILFTRGAELSAEIQRKYINIALLMFSIYIIVHIFYSFCPKLLTWKDHDQNDEACLGNTMI